MDLSYISWTEIFIGGIVLVLILIFICGLIAVSKWKMRMEACNRSIDKLGEKVNSIGSILDEKLDKLEKPEVIIQQVPIPTSAPLPDEELKAERIYMEEDESFAKATGQIDGLPVEPDDGIEFGQDEISFDDMDVFGEYAKEEAETTSYINSTEDVAIRDFDDLMGIDDKDFIDYQNLDDTDVEELFLETVTENEPAPVTQQAAARIARRDTVELATPAQQPQPIAQAKPQPQPVAQPKPQPVAPQAVYEQPRQPVAPQPVAPQAVYEQPQPQPVYEQAIYEEPSYESPFKKHQGYDVGRSGKKYTVTELETLIRE